MYFLFRTSPFLLVALLCCGCAGSNSDDYRPVTEATAESPLNASADADVSEGRSTSSPDSPSQGLSESGLKDAPAATNSTGSESASRDAQQGEASSTADAASPSDVSSSATDPPQVANRSAEPESAPPTGGSADEGIPEVKLNDIRLLVPTREFQKASAGEGWRVTFDDLDLLKVLNMERVIPTAAEYLPDWLKNLNGQQVVLRGWMRPGYRQDGITAFIFVRDNGTCCFGPKAKIYDKIGVRLKPGTTTSFIAGHPIDVSGTFTIEPDFSEPGNEWLYFMHDAVIINR